MSKPKNSMAASALGGGGMPFIPFVKHYDIVLGNNIKVTEDKRSKSRIANFPFEFPDGTRGVLIVLRVKDENWKPAETITNITLNFK